MKTKHSIYMSGRQDQEVRNAFKSTNDAAIKTHMDMACAYGVVVHIIECEEQMVMPNQI